MNLNITGQSKDQPPWMEDQLGLLQQVELKQHCHNLILWSSFCLILKKWEEGKYDFARNNSIVPNASLTICVARCESYDMIGKQNNNDHDDDVDDHNDNNNNNNNNNNNSAQARI